MSNILSESVAEKLKKMICSGEYPPGAKFPNEQELIQMLSVSRSTVREAIKLLESKSVLEIHRGVGTYVSRIPGLTNDPFGLEYVDKEQRVLDLMEMRLLLEPSVARLACEKATEMDLTELKKCAEESCRLIKRSHANSTDKQVDQIANLDVEFHSALYKCTHNSALERMFPFVRASLVESFLYPQYRYYQKNYHSDNMHNRIADAIADKKPDLAAKLCEAHIYGSICFLKGTPNDRVKV